MPLGIAPYINIGAESGGAKKAIAWYKSVLGANIKCVLETSCPAGSTEGEAKIYNRISGILSGVMLSIARITGETAPLLFTAFGNPYLSVNIGKPMQSLPLLIFNYATSPYTDWLNLAWGASLILLIWVLFLNIFTKVITRKWKVQL